MHQFKAKIYGNWKLIVCEINKFSLVFLDMDQIIHFGVDELVDPIKQTPPIISDSTSQIADTNDNVLTTEKKSTQDLVQIFTQHEL